MASDQGEAMHPLGQLLVQHPQHGRLLVGREADVPELVLDLLQVLGSVGCWAESLYGLYDNGNVNTSHHKVPTNN